MLTQADPVLREEFRTQSIQLLAHHVAEQKNQNAPRKKFPDALNFFPIRSSRFLQKCVMKLLELISRDHKAVNSVVVDAFDQVLNLQNMFRQDIQGLRNAVARLNQ